MVLRDLLLTEFDREIDRTRRTLERLPDEKSEYKPHEKSMSLVKLANHTAEIPAYIPMIFSADEFDLMQPREPPPTPANSLERLERFDALVSASRAQLAEVSEQALGANFILRAGNRTVFSDPRYHVLRNLFFNHMVHHRAQLGLYLRLNDCPVPSIYGPSADEG